MNARKRPAHPLDEAYPDVAYALAAYVMGSDDSFEGELRGYVVATDDEELGATVRELNGLLTEGEVSDDDLTSFVRRHTAWLIDGSGRRTLEAILAYFEDALRNPQPRHWLAPRVPALTRLLYEHTRSRDDLEGLVRAGAGAIGPAEARRARDEIAALLSDPTVDDTELTRFVRVHSFWMVESSGRRTLERIAATLDAGP